MAPAKAPGTGGILLPPAEPLHDRLVAAERSRARRPSSAEIEEAVEEAVEDERVHNRLTACEKRLDLLEEHRKLSVTAKVSIITAVIAVLGSLAVVVVQGLMKVHDDATADSVKQSKEAVRKDIEAAQPSTSELVTKVTDEAAAKAIDAYRKQLEEQGYVIVPKSTIRAKPPK